MNSRRSAATTSLAIRRGASIAICGASVGWLIGNSLSPVLHIIVAGVLTTVMTLVGVLAGLQPLDAGPEVTLPTDSTSEAPPKSTRHGKLRRPDLDPFPLAIFLLALVFGATIGTLARTHEWLGASPESVISKWRATKLSESEIATRVFDQLYPPVAGRIPDRAQGGEIKTDEKDKGKSDEGSEGLRHAGGLLSGPSATECTQFRSSPQEDLRRLMLASQSANVRRFAARCKDSACTKAGMEELLCPESH